MEPQLMGRVLTEELIENLKDVWNAEQHLILPDQVRKLAVTDALVDTGATLLSIPINLILQLGLKRVATKRVTSAAGLVDAELYEAVRLTIPDGGEHMYELYCF